MANPIAVLFLKIAIATPVFSNHHHDQSAAISTELRPFSTRKITSH